MSTWWLALDRTCTSYCEVKHRRVVAQGWPALGNLVSLLPFVPNHRQEFVQAIQLLGDVGYGRDTERWQGDRETGRTPTVMWNLLDIREGDLIVALEGITVKGICEARKNAVNSYRYDDPDAYEYAQTVCFPVEWIDWDEERFVFTPEPPNKGVLGVAGLQNMRDQVIEAWDRFKRSRVQH